MIPFQTILTAGSFDPAVRFSAVNTDIGFAEETKTVRRSIPARMIAFFMVVCLMVCMSGCGAIVEAIEAVEAEENVETDETVESVTPEEPEEPEQIVDTPDTSDEPDGPQISFITEDLDGNTISSDELFAQHDVTMINIWVTWCGYCIAELSDLEMLNRSLESKNCAIVGFCGDANSKDQIAVAQSLLKQNGATYLNLCPFDGWQDVFDMVESWPTTIFVDRNGVMVSTPVYGARIKEYGKHIDDALKGSTDSCYGIKVVDQNSDPVEGATVQYCSDDTCKMAVTDAGGNITFNDPPAVYEIHVLKVPDGYNNNTDSYKTKPQYSNMVIVVEKE